MSRCINFNRDAVLFSASQAKRVSQTTLNKPKFDVGWTERIQMLNRSSLHQPCPILHSISFLLVLKLKVLSFTQTRCDTQPTNERNFGPSQNMLTSYSRYLYRHATIQRRCVTLWRRLGLKARAHFFSVYGCRRLLANEYTVMSYYIYLVSTILNSMISWIKWPWFLLNIFSLSFLSLVNLKK